MTKQNAYINTTTVDCPYCGFPALVNENLVDQTKDMHCCWCGMSYDETLKSSLEEFIHPPTATVHLSDGRVIVCSPEDCTDTAVAARKKVYTEDKRLSSSIQGYYVYDFDKNELVAEIGNLPMTQEEHYAAIYQEIEAEKEMAALRMEMTRNLDDEDGVPFI